MKNSGNTDKGITLFKATHRVVLCGSMGAYGDILNISSQLNKLQVPTVIPEAEDASILGLSADAFEQFKRRVSFQYLRKIRDPRTFAVLAINVDRHGIPDYIGPNTFAEIAVTFAQSKRIYLLQGMPDDYEDELSAWRTVPLHGKLERLVEDFRRLCTTEDSQLRLF